MAKTEISGRQLLIAEWCLVAISIFFVAARLGVRYWQKNWSFWVSDAILVFSIFPFLSLIIGDTVLLTSGENLFVEPTTRPGLNWKFTEAIVYDAAFYFPRFSLLAFYHKLFPITEPKLRICLYITLAYTVAAFFTAILLDVFWCGADVSQNWSSDESACAVWKEVTTIYINWPIGMLSEILVFILPFGMLKTLKALQGGERIALICIFLLGGLTVSVSITRFILLTKGLLLYSTYLAALVEMATQIVITALPALRPLLRVGWQRVSSQMGSKNQNGSGNRKGSHTSEAGFMVHDIGTIE